MNKKNITVWTLLFALGALLSLFSCQKLENYSIDAPSDLQAKIDSIAAAKASINTGDTTYLTITTAIVGAEDYSSEWWTAFSDYFTIPTNKLLQLEFTNHNGGSENSWNNWNLCLANVADREADDYSEYFCLRSDAYGWGNEDYDGNMISNDYPDTDGDEDIWNDFRTTIDGAYVKLKIDHSVTGNVYVTATSEGSNGTELTLTYEQAVSATDDIVAFLISDASYFDIKKAFLLPSEITVVDDVAPVAIAITGTPDFVELGDTNIWGDAVATVTFADGSSTEVDYSDLSFTVIPDITTLGEKNISVAYGKTKQGEFCQPVSSFYTLEVTNSVASIAVTSMPDITTYYFFEDSIIFNTTGLEVTAMYSDGSSSIMDNTTLLFGYVPAAEGAQNVEIAYEGATSTVTTTCPLSLVKGISQVGVSDFSTPFWGAQSTDYNVASGNSVKITMYAYSSGLNSWNSPLTILRKADMTEYAVTRMDNYGWGDGYASATPTNDWNFDAMAANISGSKIIVTVTNNGDNTANIRYDVSYNNGETHYQKYDGVTIDSADLNCALTVDGCYFVIVE